MPDEQIARELGAHDARLKSLEITQAEIRADVKEILGAVNSARGGWRTIFLGISIAGAAGAVGAMFGKFVEFWQLKP